MSAWSALTISTCMHWWVWRPWVQEINKNMHITSTVLICLLVDANQQLFCCRLSCMYAADWYLRLHGWPIMPLLIGVYVFTTGLPSPPPPGVLAYTVSWSHDRRWAFTSSPTGLPSLPPTGVHAYTVGWSHHRYWASTSPPPARLHRRLTGVSAYTVGGLRCHWWASSLSSSVASSCIYGWCFHCY